MFITIHSYKGGTGKSMLSVNLAMIFATRGKDVCLLDLDLRAPSLSSTFTNKKKSWINDYLNKVCRLDRILNDCTPKHLKQGKLFVGLANPNFQAIREISSKDRKWQMEALGRIISLRSLFHKKTFDYVIIDTSPGLQYSSINAIIAADLVLMVTTLDKSDLLGTERIINELYDMFEKKTGIIANKIPQTYFTGQKPLKLEICQLPIIELIPCYCDILQSKGDHLFTFNKPDHPVTKKIQKIANKIEKSEPLKSPILNHS